MPEPMSTLSTLGAFKRLSFHYAYVFAGSILSFCALVAYFKSVSDYKPDGTNRTTIDVINEVLHYLQVPSAWAQDVQSWVDNHENLVFWSATILILLGFLTSSSSLVATRSYATTGWGIAAILCGKQNSLLQITVAGILLVICFTIRSAFYYDRETRNLLTDSHSALLFSINYLFIFFVWVVMLYSLLYGIKDAVGENRRKSNYGENGLAVSDS